MSTTIATINVNGIRAAMRRGMHEWLDSSGVDIVTMQEVRAPDEAVRSLLGDGWHVVHVEAAASGRAGVAIASRRPIGRAIPARAAGFDEPYWEQGRWIETCLESDAGPLRVISAYVHTGDANDPDRMKEKLSFLDQASARIAERRSAGEHVLLTGDLNVGHTEFDIKNWKGNRNKAGFLPEERARFDRLFERGEWVDLGRRAAGEGPGPYSWWSWRGKAFDNDAGWRIDYLIASDGLAAHTHDVRVDRAPSYDQRWSDHAPVVATFGFTLR